MTTCKKCRFLKHEKDKDGIYDIYSCPTRRFANHPDYSICTKFERKFFDWKIYLIFYLMFLINLLTLGYFM
jgi:hypothetical protein